MTGERIERVLSVAPLADLVARVIRVWPAHDAGHTAEALEESFGWASAPIAVVREFYVFRLSLLLLGLLPVKHLLRLATAHLVCVDKLIFYKFNHDKAPIERKYFHFLR